MFKLIRHALLSLCLMWGGLSAWAAVDVNKASQAELESVKGIGPSMSGKLLAERGKAAFKDWVDLIDRVSGIGPGNATRYSTAGLTVNGAPYTGGGAVKSRSKAKSPAMDVATPAPALTPAPTGKPLTKAP